MNIMGGKGTERRLSVSGEDNPASNPVLGPEERIHRLHSAMAMAYKVLESRLLEPLGGLDIPWPGTNNSLSKSQAGTQSLMSCHITMDSSSLESEPLGRQCVIQRNFAPWTSQNNKALSPGALESGPAGTKRFR